MAKEYSFGGGALTAGAITMAFINPAAAPNVGLDILRIWASQSGSTTSGQVRVNIETQASVFPTLTSATPRHLKFADTVASIIIGGTAGAAGTCGITASAEGAGTKTVIIDDNFNNLNGYLLIPTPREWMNLPAGFAQGLGLYFPSAPSSTSGWSCGINYGEV
jgi:hypothetical protein